MYINIDKSHYIKDVFVPFKVERDDVGNVMKCIRINILNNCLKCLFKKCCYCRKGGLNAVDKIENSIES